MIGQTVEPSEIANAIRDLEIGGYSDAASSLTRWLGSVSPGEPWTKDAARALVVALACQAAVQENAIDRIKPYVRDLIGAVELMAEDGALEQAQSTFEGVIGRLDETSESRRTLEVLLQETRQRMARRKLTDQWLEADPGKMMETWPIAETFGRLAPPLASLASDTHKRHIVEPLNAEFAGLYAPLLPQLRALLDLNTKIQKLCENPSEDAWQEFERTRKKAQDEGFIHPDIAPISPVLQAAGVLAASNPNTAPDAHLRALWQAQRVLDAQQKIPGMREANGVSQAAYVRLEALCEMGHQHWAELAQRVADAINLDAEFMMNSELNWLRAYLQLFSEANDLAREIPGRLSSQLETEIVNAKERIEELKKPPYKPEKVEQRGVQAERGLRLWYWKALIDGLCASFGTMRRQNGVDELLEYFGSETEQSNKLQELKIDYAKQYQEALKARDSSALVLALEEAQASQVELFAEDDMAVDLLLAGAKDVDAIRASREVLAGKAEEFAQTANSEHGRMLRTPEALDRITVQLGEMSPVIESLSAALGVRPLFPPHEMTIADLKEGERGQVDELVQSFNVSWQRVADELLAKVKELVQRSELTEAANLITWLRKWATLKGRPGTVADAFAEAHSEYGTAKENKAMIGQLRADSLCKQADRPNLTLWRRIVILAEAHEELIAANEVDPGLVPSEKMTEVEAKIAEQEAVLWSRAEAARQDKLSELIDKWSESRSKGEQHALFNEFHRSLLGPDLPLPFMAGYLHWLEAQKALEDVQSEAAQLLQQTSGGLPSGLKEVDVLFAQADDLHKQIAKQDSSVDATGIMDRLEDLRAKLVVAAAPLVDDLVREAGGELRGEMTSPDDLESAREILDQRLTPLRCVGEDQRQKISALRTQIKNAEDAVKPLDPHVDQLTDYLNDLLELARYGRLNYAHQKCAAIQQYETFWFDGDYTSLPVQQREALASKINELVKGNYVWAASSLSFPAYLAAWVQKLAPGFGHDQIPSETQPPAQEGGQDSVPPDGESSSASLVKPEALVDSSPHSEGGQSPQIDADPNDSLTNLSEAHP